MREVEVLPEQVIRRGERSARKLKRWRAEGKLRRDEVLGNNGVESAAIFFPVMCVRTEGSVLRCGRSLFHCLSVVLA